MKQVIFIGLILIALLLSGCVQENTPAGNGTAPGNGTQAQDKSRLCSNTEYNTKFLGSGLIGLSDIDGKEIREGDTIRWSASSQNRMAENYDFEGISDLICIEEIDLGYGHLMDLEDASGLAPLKNLKKISFFNNKQLDFSTMPELENLEEIETEEMILSDISWISKYKKLKKLDVPGRGQWGGFSDLSPVEGLTELTYLSVVANNFSNIEALKNLTKLEYLNLKDAPISDITPLEQLKNLEELSLTSTNVTDISTLSNLTNLKLLRLDNTKVSDISPLAALKNLETFSAAAMPKEYPSTGKISDLTALSGLTNLKELTLTGNNISDISPLSGLANLEALNLQKTQVTDVSALVGLETLDTLALDYTPIENISDLSKLTETGMISLIGTNISEEDCKKLKKELLSPLVWCDSG